MTWSKSIYRLSGVFNEDGSPETVNGDDAAVMRSLDAYAPLSRAESNTFTDSQTLAEMLNYLGDWRWLPSTSQAVVRFGRDMYELVEKEHVHRECMTFLHSRVVWAKNAIRNAEKNDERDTLKLARVYLKFAIKQDTFVQADKLARALTHERNIKPTDLDLDPELLGTPLGVVRLDTGVLVAEEEDYIFTNENNLEIDVSALRFNITKSTNACLNSEAYRTDFEYDTRWDQFIDEITDGDREKAAFLQRSLGYSILGANPEKATFILLGAKRDNGKSTLMNIVKHALGDYADEAPAGMLLVNRFENYTSANPVLAKLAGKRLVDVSEPPLGAELNGALVKKLASGTDAISTRQLHGKEFSYLPQFTIWMHCNSLPVVNDMSAIDPDHMFVIEFTRSFKAHERDFTLVDRFKSQNGMYTVLTWLIEGYLEYQRVGLSAPVSVVNATRNWVFSSGSWFDRFVKQFCVIQSGCMCSTSEFREFAQGYCDDSDETFSLSFMKKCLKSLNVVEKRIGTKRFYSGIAIKDDEFRDGENEEETENFSDENEENEEHRNNVAGVSLV